MKFTKKNMSAYGNFILGRYARLTGMTDCRALPVYLFADPSSACNLRCAMCVDGDDGSGRKRPQSIMEPDVFESLVQDVGETLFMISLYNWGEPLLNRELPRFIRRAKEFDIHVDINTNLSLKLHDSELEELLLSGPDNIVVSLDGFSPQSYGTYRRGGDFDLVKGNLVRLVELRDRMGIATEIAWKYLVFSFNEHEVEDAERFCAAKGITFSRKEAIIDVEKRPEWLPSYRRNEIQQRHGGWPFKRRSDPSLVRAGMEETCVWHYSLAAVNSDASLSPCCAVAEKAHEFGAIVPGKAGFKENWNNNSYRAARSILAGGGEETWVPGVSICRNCPYPFLKDFSGGLDTQIRRDFAARFPAPDPLLAEAFRLFDNGAEFIAYVERNYERLSALPAGGRREASVSGTPVPAGVPAGSGVCPICGRNVGFLLRKEGFSLRETFCPACGASRRSRDLAEVVLETCNAHYSLKDLAIFEAQASGPLHERLKGLPGYVCAEFLDGVAPGATGKNGVRCEDLEGLSFPDASFDLVITQDVLEHVADPGAAFREIARVLKPGGYHIFTVPLHQGRATVTRARREGELVHLFPPVYHGDPLRSSGSLVYTDFGDDLPALLAEFGFATEFLPKGVFYDTGEIPRLDSAAEVARLEELRRRGEILKFFLYNSVVVRSRRSGPVMPQTERTTYMEQPRPQPNDIAAAPHSVMRTSNPVGRYWDDYRPPEHLKTRWWQFDQIIEHVNRIICGKPLKGLSHGLMEFLRERLGYLPLEKGISIGCGNGFKEMNLVEQGIVRHFTLYELSEYRLNEGVKLARKKGLSENVTFILGDAFAENTYDQFDIFYWNNSLHHMMDADLAIKYSYDHLKPGGIFLMDDFVGPSRFQWTEEDVTLASLIRTLLPERYLRHPKDAGKQISRCVQAPNVRAMMESDPSEAADSDNILPSLHKYFPSHELINTGGIIYHLALNDILANFNETADRDLLELLLGFDEYLAANNKTHYAVAFAVKELTAETMTRDSNKQAEELIRIGEELYMNGRIDEARVLFETALRLDELNGEALNNLGVLYYELNNMELANRYLSKAAKLNSAAAGGNIKIIDSINNPPVISG